MKDNKIELLLNNIYSQVDLKEGIFDYVQPFILRAYGLLKSDDLNKENGKNDNILFRNIDVKNEVENILYRDLPGIIAIYTKMPLDYRNEKLVKNSQTHRQLLIENIIILTTKLKDLEHGAYEHFDTHVKVSNRFIKERYSNFVHLSEVEVEKDIVIKDNFKWFNYRKDNIQQLSTLSNNLPKDNNKKIVLQENIIQYKVKDHHRHFMSGVYDAYTKFSTKLSKLSVKMDKKYKKAKYNVREYSAFYFFLVSILSIPSTALIYCAYTDSLIKPAKDMEKIAQIIDGSENFRDLTIRALDKFAKENEIVLQYTPNKEAVYAYKEMSKTQCVHSIEYMQSYHSYSPVSRLNYYINNRLIEQRKNLDEKMAKEICELPQNIMTFGTFKLK